MKTMLFAAGRGERMRPLTDITPKPLLPVGGKPLIAWHLEKCARAGLREVVINHAWLGAQIETVIGDGSAWNVRVHYSPEAQALETAGGIVQAGQWLDLRSQNIFCALAADVYSDYDYANFAHHAENMRARGFWAWCVLVPNPAHHPAGDFCLLENNLLVDAPSHAPSHAASLSKRAAHSRDNTYTFSGLALYHPQLFAGIAQGGSAKLAPLLRAAMAQGKVGGEIFHGRWADVGTVERLQQLDRELKINA